MLRVIRADARQRGAVRHAAVGGELGAKAGEPAIGIARGGGVGGLLVGLLDGGTGDQGQYHGHYGGTAVMEIAYRLIKIELHGAPTAGVALSIGAEHAFADCDWVGQTLLFTNVAVRDELLGSLTVTAGGVVELRGLLLDGDEAGVVNLHGGLDIKEAHLAIHGRLGRCLRRWQRGRWRTRHTKSGASPRPRTRREAVGGMKSVSHPLPQVCCVGQGVKGLSRHKRDNNKSVAFIPRSP